MEPKEKPRVFIAATSQELLDKAVQAGATLSTSGSPIVGTAGLILGLAKFKKIEALCLLGRNPRLPAWTRSQPKACSEVLKATFNFELWI